MRKNPLFLSAKTLLGVMVIGLFHASAVGAQSLSAEPLKTEGLAATCASCHGTQGISAPGYASQTIAGKPQDYLMAQLKAFKTGQRPATVMHQIAKGYSDEQLEALAQYFAAVKP
jgi:cytochrome c553